MHDVVAVLADDAPEPIALEEFGRVLLEMQLDARPSNSAGPRRQLEAAVARGGPLHGLGAGLGGQGVHDHPVRDHERRVKSHAELTDEVHVGLPLGLRLL